MHVPPLNPLHRNFFKLCKKMHLTKLIIIRGWPLQTVRLSMEMITSKISFLISLLSPQTYMKRPIMAAEIEVYCIQSMRDTVLHELENSVKNGDSSILSDYLYTENRCK